MGVPGEVGGDVKEEFGWEGEHGGGRGEVCHGFTLRLWQCCDDG